MKTPVFACIVLLLTAVLFPNCKKDENCQNPGLSLEKVEPSSNPPGYEIRLTGDGFSNAAIVRFDNSESSNTRFLDANTLIATIPQGLLGAVEVSVEDGGCIERNDRFEIFADFPSNIPFSPATIIIPQAASVYPISFQNCWTNLFDPAHCLQFNPDFDLQDGSLDTSSVETHTINQVLDRNPITGYIRFNETTNTSDIKIQIDRRKTEGEILESYVGTFIDPASVGSENAFVILLTSEKDGRQLLIKFGG